MRKPKLHLPWSFKNKIPASELNVSLLLSAWFGCCDFHAEKHSEIHSRKWKVGCIVLQVDFQKSLSGSWYVRGDEHSGNKCPKKVLKAIKQSHLISVFKMEQLVDP